MRVGATPPSGRASPPREVAPRLTPVSQGQLRDAIARAHKKLTGRAPSPRTLDVLTAHASLETASGARMYNFNFGGIKGHGPTGETARCKTREVIDGKEVTIRDGFRAYRTIDEGAADYMSLMRDRFPGAMEQASRGDVDGFARALKRSRYYTADEGAYAAGLRGLMKEPGARPAFDARLPGAPAGSIVGQDRSSAGSFVDDAQLARVMDAIGHHRPTIEPDDEE